MVSAGGYGAAVAREDQSTPVNFPCWLSRSRGLIPEIVAACLLQIGGKLRFDMRERRGSCRARLQQIDDVPAVDNVYRTHRDLTGSEGLDGIRGVGRSQRIFWFGVVGQSRTLRQRPHSLP